MNARDKAQSICYDADKKPINFGGIRTNWKKDLPLHLTIEQVLELLNTDQTTASRVLGKVDPSDYVPIEGIPHYLIKPETVQAIELAILERPKPPPRPKTKVRPAPPPEPVVVEEPEPIIKPLATLEEKAQIYFSTESSVAVYVVRTDNMYGERPLSELLNDMFRQSTDVYYGVERKGTYFSSPDHMFTLGIMLVHDPDIFLSRISRYAEYTTLGKGHPLADSLDSACAAIMEQRAPVLPNNTKLEKLGFTKKLVADYKKILKARE